MDGFDAVDMTHGEATVNGVRLHYVTAGEKTSRPLLLLHGFPQTWIMWRFVIPVLAEEHFVVAADLRGYGDSEKMVGGHDQGTKAADIEALTEYLDLERFLLVGHDRGGRVARRYALDFPARLRGLALLDILPSEYIYDDMSAAEVTRRYWHWVFQVVPDLPELLIYGNEDAYLKRFFGRRPAFLKHLEEEGAYAEYYRAFLQPGAVVSALQDYRETFTVDVPRYRSERLSGRKITVPTLLMWGDGGNLSGLEVEHEWSKVAENVVDAIEVPDCGHYLPEEQPAFVADYLLRFARERFTDSLPS